MATAVIHRISVHPTAGTAPPEPYPTPGNNYSAATLINAGWITLGDADDRGDSGDIDSEAVKITPIDEGVIIRPAGALTNKAKVQRHCGIDTIEFTAYDVSQAVFELDSNVVSDENVSVRTTTQTYRSVLIERDGLVLEWYPKVDLHVVDETGGFGPGDDAVSKLKFKGTACSYSNENFDVPAGQLKMYHAEVGS